MNISILASIWAHNLGDELILKNEIALLKQEFGLSSSFRVFSYDLKNPFYIDPQVRYREYFPIWIKNPKNILRNTINYFGFINTLLWSDIVVIGGGWIFYDSELQSTRNPLDAWLFRTRLARMLRKKIYFYGVSIDIQHPKNLEKIQEIFTWAHKITVRNDNSQDLLLKLGIESELVDDPVSFDKNWTLSQRSSLLKALESKKFDLNDIKDIDFKDKTVGFALRKWYFTKSWSEQIEVAMIKELFRFVQDAWGKVILLPHSFHPTDIKANDYEFLKQFWYIISESMQETYEYYIGNKLDIVFAQRLHSMILAEAYQIPYVALSYSKKTHGQLKKLPR